jgi:hypothetical protein
MVDDMAVVSAGLTSLRDLMSRVIDQLTDIVGLLPPQASAGPDVVAILTQLTRAIAAWGGSIAAKPEGTSPRNLRDGLTELGNIARVFRFVSSVTAMQAPQMRTAMLDRFVEDLREVATRIEAEVGDAGRAATRLGGLRTVIETSVDEADTTFRLQADRAADIMAPVTGLAAAVHADSARTADTADRSRRCVQAEITGIVTALQFSDAASQRLEHVEQILAQGGGGAAAAHLAAAQLTALAAAGRAMMADLERNFTTLEAAAGQVTAVFQMQGELAGRLFAAQTQAFGALDRIRADLDPVVTRVSQAVVRAREDVDGMQDRLGRLADIGMAIHLAAMNARVQAGRESNARDVLAHISGIVRESAGVGRAQIDRCLDALLQIRTTYGSDSLSAVQDNLAELAAAVQRNQRDLLAAQGREAALVALREEVIATAARLTLVIANARGGLQQLGATMSGLGLLAAELARSGPKPASFAELAMFKAIYTMDSEREVHAAFCGEELVTKESAPLELDDILF